jgi:hypothetical protein
MKLISLFLCTGTVCLAGLLPLDKKNPFGYPDAAADAALAHAEGDAGRLEELLAFPAALALPRLDQYLRKRPYPEHTKMARELIPQVTGWLEYYQWTLAEAYKKANPAGNLAREPGDGPKNQEWVDACWSRGKIGTIFETLSMLDRPEAIGLLASYLDDRGKGMSDEDVGIPSVQSMAGDSLNSYFQRTTGKFTTTNPDKWRDWWVANKSQYPPLPEKPPKPWFPPPNTPAPATPRLATPDPIIEMIRRVSEKREPAFRRALEEAEARRRTPPPPTTPPATALIPHIRTEEEARPWRWVTAIVCTLLAGGAAYFVFRERR